MSTKHSKLNGATAFTIIASIVFLLVAPLTSHANNECRPDQTQLQNQAAIPFGAQTVLGQMFVPNVQGRQVCMVKVHISKNLAGAKNLTLRVVRPNFTELDVATIAGADIPMGNSVQVFDFGCNGAALVGMPFYGLKLESKSSPMGAYSWKGIGGNVYNRPGEGDKGWRNVNDGVGNWTSLAAGAWDFAFEVYLCS